MSSSVTTSSIRARRTSAKQINYSIPKPYITDSDDDSNSDNNNNNEIGEGGKENKKKGKKVKKDSPGLSDNIETDVSEYDAEEEEDKKNRIRKLKGKGKAEVDSSEDDDDEDGEPTSDSDSDDDDDEDNSSNDDDLESDPGSPGEGGCRKRNNNNKRTTNPGGGRKATITPRTKSTALKVTPRIITTTNSNNSANLNSKRANNLPPPQATITRAVGVGYYDKFGVPFHPPLRKLSSTSHYFVGSEIEEGKDLVDEEARVKLYNDWCRLPLAPDRARIQDVGWWKGKWNEEENRINDKWGGWYSELKPQAIVRINVDDVSPYLPKNCHPSTPVALTTIDKPVVEEGEEGENQANQMEVDEDVSSTSISIWVGDASSQDNAQKLITFERFDTHRLDSILETKPGNIFNAGAPVSGLSWCPGMNIIEGSNCEYLAVSTLATSVHIYHNSKPTKSMIQIWSLDTSIPSDLSPTTQDEKGSGMKFELGLCIDVGDAINIEWCPKGGRELVNEKDSTASLGILAGVFTDGSICLFSVPDPKVVTKKDKAGKDGRVYVKSTPILRLSVASTTMCCFSWGSHETIIAGCMDGSVIVWDIGTALRSGAATPRPVHFFRPHFAAIRDINFILAPPYSDKLDGTIDLNGEPNRFIIGGYDGTTTIYDLRDPACRIVLSNDRGIGVVAAYDTYTGTVHANDPECRTKALFLKPGSIGGSKKIIICQGPVLTIALSSNHPYCAVTSTDGSVLLANSLRTMRKTSHNANYVQKLYRFDFNRKTGEYRMLDNFLPELRKPVDAIPHGRKPAKAPEPDEAISGAWPACLSVLASSWHPDLNRACLLSSGLACGLVRVDWIERVVGAVRVGKRGKRGESESESDSDDDDDEVVEEDDNDDDE